MSGTVDVNAILGHPQPQGNFLQLANDWQDYQNKQQALKNAIAQNAQIQATTANTQQSTAASKQSMAIQGANRHAQDMASILALPDNQIPAAAQAKLDAELQTGQISMEQYNAGGAMVRQAIQSGDVQQLKNVAAQHIMSTLAGPEQMMAATPKISETDIGGQMVPRVAPSTLSLLTNPSQGLGIAPGAINRTQPPGYQSSGGQLIPVGGAQGAPVINQTLSPEASTGFVDQLVQNPDGTYAVKQIQRGQLNPSVAAAGTKGGFGGGALGSGGYPAPQPVSKPLGTEAALNRDQELYKADQAQVQPLTTGTQSLGKALKALNAVATGAGTEGLARMRAYATSLGNVMGVDTGGVNVQDMNRAELEKYLIEYARSSSTAGRSDEALTAAFKSNASGSINNAAAQDVVRTNIGRDRQKIASTMTQQNPMGADYSNHKATYATQTDPRGFAWDSYTDAQKAEIIKETQGTQGKNSPEYRKLARAVGDAQRLGLLNFSAPQPANVNAAPPTMVPQQQPQGNNLQGPPA